MSAFPGQLGFSFGPRPATAPVAAAPKPAAPPAEFLEFRVPGAVFSALGQARANAVCFGASDRLRAFAEAHAAHRQSRAAWNRGRSAQQIAVVASAPGAETAEWRSRFAAKLGRSATRSAADAKHLSDLAARVAAAERDMRAAGVRGAIPVCLYREKGKKSGDATEYGRMEVEAHERFHAQVRRMEVHAGAPAGECEKWLSDELRQADAGRSNFGTLAVAAVSARWGSKYAEEILARLASVENVCATGAPAVCAGLRDHFRQQLGIIGRCAPADPACRADAFDRLGEAVSAGGGAAALAQRAISACARGGP